MKTTQIISLIFLIMLFNGCKKTRKGVLEIKTTTTTGKYNYFKAINVEDGVYEPNVEFNYKTDNYATSTAYYWPDESPKSLGYTYRNKGEEGVYFTTEDEGSSITPGETGHWACPVGNWENTTACGGTKIQNFVLNADNTGWADNPDCNNICDPMVWPFTYEINGNTCNLYYTTPPDVNCGGTFYPVNQPNNASFTFSCDGGNTLVTSFGTFTRSQ